MASRQIDNQRTYCQKAGVQLCVCESYIGKPIGTRAVPQCNEAIYVMRQSCNWQSIRGGLLLSQPEHIGRASKGINNVHRCLELIPPWSVLVIQTRCQHSHSVHSSNPPSLHLCHLLPIAAISTSRTQSCCYNGSGSGLSCHTSTAATHNHLLTGYVQSFCNCTTYLCKHPCCFIDGAVLGGTLPCSFMPRDIDRHTTQVLKSCDA